MADLGICEGRVAVVTGAGRGIGRAEALELARQGARLVVNDLGGQRDGTGSSDAPANEVVEEIRGFGGDAIPNSDDVATWSGAERLILQAIDSYGTIDVLVNNAGILKDRMIINMTENEWDDVIRVHLKGTFGPTHFAARYWRERSKAGHVNDARVINTSSASGIYGNTGQSNYGAAKAGIAAFTIIASREFAGYGVTVNALAPAARTRMTDDRPMGERTFAEAEFDQFSPLNLGPLVAWLASPESHGVTGRVFNAVGGLLGISEGWRAGPSQQIEGRWDVKQLGEAIPHLLEQALPVPGVSGRSET